MQRLPPFCNIHTPDDGLRLNKQYEGNKLIMEGLSTNSAGYHKIDTATWKD